MSERLEEGGRKERRDESSPKSSLSCTIEFSHASEIPSAIGPVP